MTDYATLCAKLDECQQQMFDRYDLDGSVTPRAPFCSPERRKCTRLATRGGSHAGRVPQGTLNEAKELRQLCTNICMKLELVVSVRRGPSK